MRQRRHAGAEWWLIRAPPGLEGARVLHRAEGDVERERGAPRGGDDAGAVAKHESPDQRDRREAREDRIEDEDPVERVAMLRDGKEEHRAERRDPVEENVRADPDRGEEPERREPGAAKHEARDERDQEREDRQNEERMRPPAVVAQVVEARPQVENVEIRQHRRDQSDREGGARTRAIRGRSREHAPREAVSHRIHGPRDDTGRTAPQGGSIIGG